MLVGGFLGAGFSRLQWPGILVGALLRAHLIGGPIFLRERKRNDCTYVGTLGIARFPFGTSRSAHPKGKIFLFANAVDLQTAFLGRNSGTNFNYQWKNAIGQTLYKLEGSYYGRSKNPDPDATYHFACAAEGAWTHYLLPQVMEEIRRTGSYRFLIRRGLVGGQYAVIGPGNLEVVTGDKRFHCTAAEIDDIVVHHGWIIIRRKNAQDRAIQSLDGTHGICYFNYGSVSNVRIFLTLLKTVVGVAWRSGE